MYYNDFSPFLKQLFESMTQPFSLLILQILVIISVTGVLGIFFKKIGQPTVIGQITAGIVLGPSLMGLFFPEVSNFIFPADSLKSLKLFSELGLTFFMFIVGMELNIDIIKHRMRTAIVVSNAGIIIPFLLGILLSYFLYKYFAVDSGQFLSFSLFIGISVSITAFPVLVRIIQERGISKTHVGTLATTCAAGNDVAAWCLLVAVIAIARVESITTAFITILLSIVYLLGMFKIVRPLIKKYSKNLLVDKNLHKTAVSLFFIMMLASSYITNIIGIHFLFGAFVGGLVMPHNMVMKKYFIEKIEDVSLVLLLPIFFVFSGLHTQINLLNTWSEWLLLFIITTVAVVGKFWGCAVAAKIMGESWKDSLSIGALMNTRGLMELIVLNIGYDLGIIKTELFAILVLMALITTALTNPLLDLIDKIFYQENKNT